MNHPYLWYRDKDSVPIGGVRRYRITYSRVDESTEFIYFRLKNIERATVRAIHLVNGPFILYCHVIPVNFDHTKKFEQQEREIHFNNQLKPGQTFNVKLLLNENSRVEKNIYSWEVDIVSQIVISNTTSVLYDLMVGNDFQHMKKLNHGPFRSLTGLTNLTGSSGQESIELNRCFNPQLSIEKFTEDDIWSRAPQMDKPVHLVIITHGIFSNLTADMLYLKETLEQSVGDNLLIKGYNGNAGRTERGVKKLGIAQGKYIMQLIDNLISQDIKISKISFIGHSLGGLVQLYSIKYILDTENHFFSRRGIKPHNLVFMASPLLGILNEISFLLSWLLDLGTLGKTGRDLTLAKTKLTGKSLVEQLPDYLHEFFLQCDNLILYANAINDGIVPLRTSALLYLDYATLDNVQDLKRHKEHTDDVGEIAADKRAEKMNVMDKYKQLISLNFNLKSDKKRVKLQRKIMQINAKSVDNDNLDTGKDTESAELDQDDAEEVDEASDTVTEDMPNLNIPPKASIVESAIKTIVAPVPNQEFIINPESRHSTIFHDKFYKYTNLPPDNEEHTLFNKEKKQVKIARKYHNGLNWRKILVRLPPDAHNNIVVRRKFANGYGWGVVDHLCLVFNEDTGAKQSLKLEKIRSKM